MNKKTMVKYELIAQIVAMDGDSMGAIRELCENDFQTAFDMWEYKLGQGQPIAAVGIEFFNAASESKMRAAFIESRPAQHLVYTSPEAATPTAINYLANFVLLNKLDTADECLARMRANTNIDFNEVMRVIIDTTFSMYCQRNNVRVPVFNKKQKTLLLNYIDKIKGPNKALLLQRMKEI